jgi:phosphohistidine phosphatase
MRLYLLRHGTAEELRPGLDDADRALTSKGYQQCQQVADLLRRLDVAPQVVASSPLRRALQTAEEVVRCAALGVTVRPEALLASGAIDHVVDALLAEEVDCLLAVGHEPQLSLIAGALVGEGGSRIDLRKGGVVELELLSRRPPRAVLLGLLRPAHLR